MIVFPQALVLSPSLEQPLSHSRIGWHTYTRDANGDPVDPSMVTVSSESADGPKDAPLLPDTAQYWKPSAMPATWELDLGGLVDLDYIGIATGSIGSGGCAAKWETSSDRSSWSLFSLEQIPGDDAPLVFHDASRTARYVRLTLQGVTPPQVGPIYVGELLAMPRPPQAPFKPPSLSRTTELQATMSRGGQFFGQNVRSRGFDTSVGFKLLDAAWMRSHFRPFILAAERFPYFFIWHPQAYPLEVGFAWSEDPIHPQHDTFDLMSVSWRMRGIGNE